MSNAARYQLRSYLVAPEHLDEFLDIWERVVVPLRARHGLHTLAGWVSLEGSRFTWISFVDKGVDYRSTEAAYLASHERRSLDPDPANWLLATDVHFVRPVREPVAR